jgi:hypothetical protein
MLSRIQGASEYRGQAALECTIHGYIGPRSSGFAPRGVNAPQAQVDGRTSESGRTFRLLGKLEPWNGNPQ